MGYNPVQHLLGPHVLASLSLANRTALTGRSFFPQLISTPFRSGLHAAFIFAILACLIAAAASLMRGGRYHYTEQAPALSSTGEAEAEQVSPAASRRAASNVPAREEQHAH